MASNKRIRNALMYVNLLLAFVWAPQSATADTQRRDSTSRRPFVNEIRVSTSSDLPNLRHRMLTSAIPVEIRQQGRHLCVTSRQAQLLPIYSSSGTLYSSFRLSKGTNWLSGLPRGSYFINNRKITIN